MHFHARYGQVTGEGEQPMSALRTSGKGHYVGMSVVVQATSPGNVAAGRIAFNVDGDASKGPGGEKLLRYFGNMFGVNQHSTAYSGATLAEGSRVKARTSMYRFHVKDPIPFSESIEVTMERGPDNGRSDNLSAVAYWYQAGVATPSGKLASSRDRRWEAPSDEELRRGEEAQRQKQAAAAKRKRETEAQAQRERLKLGRIDEGATPRGGSKMKRIDASAAPCHGMVYHGVCNKENCNFDHDPGRCAAFKEKHPAGPPRAERK